jgi:hypothetical protein
VDEILNHWKAIGAYQMEEHSSKMRALLEPQATWQAVAEQFSLNAERADTEKLPTQVAQLDATARNMEYLLLLELQEAGKSLDQDISFPCSKEDFELLKSLGFDRQFTKFTTFVGVLDDRLSTLGFELEFRNGQKVQRGFTN